MRCTNKNEKTIPRERRSTYQREISRRRRQRRLIIRFVSLLVILVLLLGGLGYEFLLKSHEIELVKAYDKTDSTFGLTTVSFDGDFFHLLCLRSLCGSAGADVVLSDFSVEAVSAAIFSEADHQTVYAKAVHERRYPASLTKIMTCLVALKNGNLDEMVTVGDECRDIDVGSSVCEIQPGDVLSLRELLLGLMINSGNDAAMTIAKNVGGSVENFVAMMNEQAAEIGAVNTHVLWIPMVFGMKTITPPSMICT
ncbi:MAG: D-alanyl-D-alanine carboxypeptidase family protein [Lachnospiraceae bacterium]